MFELLNNSVNGLDKVDMCFIIYFIFLFAIWLFKVALADDTQTKNSRKSLHQVYRIAINKKRFVKEIINWGINNINVHYQKRKEIAVNYEISYYRHRTIKGVFYPIQNKIRIYVNNHINIIDLIDSSLHEVVHALQFCADKKGYQKKYTKLLEEHNYAAHPMEIEARTLAEKNIKSCVNYLFENGYLVKREI